MKDRLFYIILFCLIVNYLYASKIEVCSTCPTTSLTAAIAIAEHGDVILVKKGLYQEGNIIVDKSLTLLGEDFPIFDGQHQSEIFTITADSVTIQGFQIQNVGTSYVEDRAGIRIKKAKHFHILGNRLYDTFFGIYLEHSHQGFIHNNIVLGKAEKEMSSGNAIHLWYSNEINILNNKVSGHRDGIYLEFVNHSEVINNWSEGNLRYGLHFMFSNDDSYECNTFRDNGAGVAVMFSRRINMQHNLFEMNWGTAAYGLLLKEIYDATIEYNIFKKNTLGIYVEGANRIQYRYNDFIQNGWAVKITGGCLDNTIQANNFLSNTFDLAVHTKSATNIFDGNYWSDYAGYDLNRDGFGDVPHRPVKLFSFVVNQTPEAIILMRSLFVDILNFSEKVSPVFTPANVLDQTPLMKKIDHTMKDMG